MADDTFGPRLGLGEAPQRTSELEPEDRVRRLRRWFKESLPVCEDWRKDEYRPSAEFVDGHQWDSADEAKLKDEGRPIVTFNRIAPTIDAACGVEIGQQQEITCKQKGMEDAAVAETATALVEWVDDQCDAATEESDAFRDALIAGLGWVEMRVDDIGERRIVEERIDPLEMIWDASAKRRNFQDARYVFRVKEMALETAREMFPGTEDEDLNCTWLLSSDDRADRSWRRGYRHGREDRDEPGERVTICEAQWRELEQVGVIVHADGRREELRYDQLDMAAQRMTMMGTPPTKVDQEKRWCVYQTFIGRKELEGPAKLPGGDDLAYQAITGKWDQKKGYPYGIVRAAMDPQRYANKWMLQQLHILNTTAKNTLLYEEGAFVDQDTAIKEWAQPGGKVAMRPGAIVNRRYEVVTGQTMQAVLGELMMFALNSIRECTGINLEMLGQVAREQAGVLEQERKKAAVTILAVYFKNLTAARKVLGKLRLRYVLSGVIPPADLAEAVGPEKAPQLPQLMADKALRYDVIVDESPTSPNAKDRYWTSMQPILPVLVKRTDLPPEVWAELVRYMPIPSGMSEALVRAFTQPKQPDPMAERMKAAQVGQEEAEVAVKQTKAQLQAAQAGQQAAEAGLRQAQAGKEQVETAVQLIVPDGQAGPPA